MKNKVFTKKVYVVIVSGILFTLVSSFFISCDSNKEKTITYSNGDKYVGQTKNKYRDGTGICTYYNGDKYEGQFGNGTFNGTGTFIYADGTKKQGRFSNGKFQG